jgi:hypothetical protein
MKSASGKASRGHQPAGGLENGQARTPSPVREKPAGHVTVDVVSLGENAMRDGDRYHRVMPDRVQESVGYRAVYHEGLPRPSQHAQAFS